MAEFVVKAVVQQLVSIATGWLQEEISLLKGVKPKLENMKTNMGIIQTVVEDAENQSVKKKIVKLWLEKLQDVSYDMDDVLDEWSTKHILEREEAEEKNTSDQIVGSSSSPTTCLSLKQLNCFSSVKQLPWRREIAKRIKDINERINLLFLDMEKYELVAKAVGYDVLDRIINHNDIVRTTTSFVDESTVYGRDDDKDFLLSKVLAANTEHEKSLQVISIVGAGGLGKTTLAQLVFNDEKVVEKFGEKRIWVCVSNPFDEFKVARHILEGLKVKHTKMISLQNLYQSVGDSLSGHKFLLVLDDVWNEDFEKWRSLGICLKLGDPASRLLVTTRKEEVATMMDTTPSNILKPRLISDLDCWFLMSQIAFLGRTNQDNDKFEDIGKEIAKKCKGLPLAVKALGGMLMSKDSVDEWIPILNSEIWKLKNVEMELFPHIFLSYQELHAVLKHCFLILAIFPKDTALTVERVIEIWMAHGFLNQGTKEDDMVKTGQNYLKILVSRAFLEKGKWWQGSMISMHDIMHDFAIHLSGAELISTRVLDKIENDSRSKSTSKGGSCLKSTRQLYIDGDVDPSTIGFDVEKLRTCIIQNVAMNVASDLVKELKMVRALYLVRCDLEQVPPSIENLIHLRLFDLSDNPLVKLPETIGGLYNLQQLILESVELSSLPDSMGELTNLIFLKPDHLVWKMAPESVGKLINLHHLNTIKVEAGKSELGFLKDLNQLRGVLKIEFKSDYGDVVDAKKGAIERKKHITELELFFNDHEIKDGVIAALQPPSNIQKVGIYGFPPSCVLLPGWITSLDHLTGLVVRGARNVSTLPPLGELQSLKKLHISGFAALKIIGGEFVGMGNKPNKKCSAFPKLVELRFFYCDELTGWEDLKPGEEDSISVMPNLEILNFEGCDNFDGLPRRLLRQARSLRDFSILPASSNPYRANIPGRLCLERGHRRLEMIVEGSTKVPISLNYHSYVTLLDIYCAEQPISYLPPMGKLPYLQSLEIDGFRSLELIGRDLLGIDDSNNDEDFVAFPNLLKLEIRKCGLQQWEDLKPEDEGKVTVMPKLQHLKISGCPKLQVLPSRLLRNAASLEKLEIYGCDLLQEWEDLKPEDEDKVTVMPKLRSLRICCCPNFQVLPSRLLNNAASLEDLNIDDCGLVQWEDLKPEDEGKVIVMPKLQRLKIGSCKNLQVLPSRLLRNAASLEELKIYRCGLLQEWEDLKPENEDKVTVMPKLRSLRIWGCPKFQVLPSRLLCRSASLEELRCNNNDSLAENIKKDEQLLRHVKNVYVDDQQCSLHPSADVRNEFREFRLW